MAQSKTPQVHPQHLPVDLSRWATSVVRWPRLDEFLSQSPIGSTLHTIGFPSGVIDILISGDALGLDRNPVLPVFLSGATSDRTNQPGPFFSGATIAQEIGVPALSIADPTISDHDLRLAWYSGCSRFNGLQAIASTLSGVIERFDVDLLFVGGSGGGFASLALAEIIGERASAFVWNPQTDILEYQAEAVGRWLDEAFGDKGTRSTDLDSVEGKHALRRVLDALEISTQVGAPEAHHNALIIQNTSDHWHLSTHARPYAARAQLEAEGASFSDGRRHLAIGDWPGGHVVPPRPILIESVRSLLAGIPPGVVHKELIMKFPEYFDLEPRSLASLDQGQFKVYATPGAIRVQFTGNPTGFLFAFYAYGPNGRVHTHWYSDDAVYEFVGDLADDVTGVSCFVRNSITDQCRFEVRVDRGI